VRGLRRYKLNVAEERVFRGEFLHFFAYSMTERRREVRMLANLVSKWRKRSALVIISVLVSGRG